MRPLQQQQQRGAASVEAAISMLVFIPAFMYALFLDDLLRYAGDLQESVVSTPWDYTGQDYTRPGSGGLGTYQGSAPPGGQTLVQSHARLMFCDHESSGDSYNQGQDCDNLDHHEGKALSGHACWLNGNAHQITCEPVQTNVGDMPDSTGVFSRYKSSFGTAGGLYECHGRKVVENYLLPKSFLQKFSKVDLSKKNWKDEGDIHSNAKAGDSETAYYLATQRFALVTDPWALNDKRLQARPGQKDNKNDLYARVDHLYKNNNTFNSVQSSAQDFLQRTSDQELLGPSRTAGGSDNDSFDDPTTPNLSLPPAGEVRQDIQQDEGSQGYIAIPWEEDSSMKYSKGGRGDYYMGCEEPEKC